jgi:16S rRNA (guanine527-N7)-methyltransferase
MKALLSGARQLGIELPAQALQAFETYYRELIAWNTRLNLTTIIDYQQFQIEHILDSLTCLLAVELDHLRVIDVGTGAGFPGLPLKIVRPQMRLSLLESTIKKIRFLRYIVGRLNLTGVEIIQGRAEEGGRTAEHRERYDVALGRGVARLPVLLEYTLPFLKPGGALVAQRGKAAPEEIEAAKGALEILGGRISQSIPVRLPTLDEVRYLVVVRKVARTPEGYPRRAGIPAKRPLQDQKVGPGRSQL